MWPFTKREKRQSSYTDTLVKTIVEQAGASFATPTATGALESCAGLVARSFAAAKVEAPDMYVSALGPRTLSMIGRALIRSGEVVFRLSVRDGRVALEPAASWDVSGGPDPRSWTYQLHLAGPDGQTSLSAPADGVIHVRYQSDPEQPWIGVSPLGSAALAGKLSAETITALADEASGPRGHLLPLPVAGDDPTVASLKGDLKNLKGRVALVESVRTMAAGAASPRGDWQTTRFGANPPDALVNLAELASREVYAACGCPAVLFAESGDGTSRREAYRQWAHTTLQPMVRIVEEELTAKLETSVVLNLDNLFAADVASRARAYQSLTGAGMDAGTAAKLAGFLAE